MQRDNGSSRSPEAPRVRSETWPERRVRESSRERGTVLLLIVGVLAMLSIIAVVYAAIGRADRLGSAAFRRESEIEGFVKRVVDYHLQIIGDDVFDTVTVKGLGDDGRPKDIEIREPWDVPSIDSTYISDATHPFAVTGGGTDPWLAPIEPDYDTVGSAGNPTWGSVSVVAPDGRFASTVALRNAFDQPPGYSRQDDGTYGLNAQLGYTDQSGSPRPYPPASLRKPAAIMNIDFGNAAPMADYASLPGDPENRLNQWVDADGDGILDSRLWLPVDSRDPLNIRQIIPSASEYRFFVGTRIIDLCGLVNVNTATDFRGMPAGATDDPMDSVTIFEGFPAGLTPADVDIRRLFSLEGVNAITGLPFDYSQIDSQVFTGGSAAPFGNYTGPIQTALIGDAAYQGLRSALGSSGIPDVNVVYPGPSTPLNAIARAHEFEGYAAGKEGAVWGEAITMSGGFAYSAMTPFGIGCELELRAHEGVNDSNNTTRLEASLAGRWPTDKLFDPLRSTRSSYFERGQRDLVDNSSPGVPRSDGRVDPSALNQMQADVRHLITTVSAERPLATRLVDLTSSPGHDRLSTADLKINPFEEMFERLPATVPGMPPRVVGLDDDGLQRVFGALFECLAPFATHRAWELNANPAARSAAYGGSPETAVQAALHLVANWADAFDDDYVPTRLTVRITDATGTSYTQDPTNGPVHFYNDDSVAASGDWRTGEVKIPDDRGTPDPSDDSTHTPADLANLYFKQPINVYGIEPQAFLTEATSFIIFNDAKPAAGGDDECGATGDGDGDGVPDESTIDFTADGSNADYVGEILAFQVANPFDCEIVLGKPEGTSVSTAERYYFEYGGRFFMIPEQDSSGEDVVLGPGEARVFYVTDRLSTNPADPASQMPAELQIRNWFTDAGGQPPVELTGVVPIPGPQLAFDLNTADKGQIAGAGGRAMLHDFAATDWQARVRVVNLWRAVLDPDLETLAANDRDNDILVDRMRDEEQGPPVAGQAVGLALRENANPAFGLPAANTEIPLSTACDQDDLTAVFWRGWLRPSWGAAAPSRGAMPPWAIEVPLDGVGAGYASRNDAYETAATGAGTLADYLAGLDGTYFEDMASASAGAGQDDVNGRSQLLRKSPNSKPRNGIGVNASNVGFIESAVEVHLRGRTSTTVGVAADPGNPSLFLRPADLLLSLAVGPWNAPEFVDPLNGGSADEVEREWMTLSEAIALSMDYYSPADHDHPLYKAGHLIGAGAPNPVFERFDRGHLSLTRYVPFYDEVRNGKRDLTEPMLGLGVPLAWNVLDRFRTDSIGSLTVAKPGIININTAPLRVLRTVPMLSPAAGANWWGTGADPAVVSTAVQNLGGRADPAASVAAYRDRDALYAMDGVLLDYSDTFLRRDEKAGILDLRYFAGPPGAQHPLLYVPGFFSLGEIMAARDGTTPGMRSIHDIDFLGFDGAAGAGIGLDADPLEPTRYERTAAAPWGKDDQIPNDYDEQLAIANAALNSLSIRSDVFCVWFVVQGYLPSDVEGLTPDDPLVPSLARRYVMVVDRSNVTKRGDKPRVLFLQEVPM